MFLLPTCMSHTLKSGNLQLRRERYKKDQKISKLCDKRLSDITDIISFWLECVAELAYQFFLCSFFIMAFFYFSAAPLCYIFEKPVELFYVFRQLYSRYVSTTDLNILEESCITQNRTNRTIALSSIDISPSLDQPSVV